MVCLRMASGSSHVGSSDSFVLSFLQPAFSCSPYLQFFCSLIYFTSFILVSLVFPTWQLVWWEDIPPRSREHPHEQRSWFLHCPGQSELSWWLLHLCQVSAPHNVFLPLFLVNGLFHKWSLLMVWLPNDRNLNVTLPLGKFACCQSLAVLLWHVNENELGI